MALSSSLGGSGLGGFELKNKDQALIGLAVAGVGLVLLVIAIIMM